MRRKKWPLLYQLDWCLDFTFWCLLFLCECHKHHAQHVNFPVLILYLLSQHFKESSISAVLEQHCVLIESTRLEKTFKIMSNHYPRRDNHYLEQRQLILNLHRQLCSSRALLLAGEDEGSVGMAAWLLQILLPAKLEEVCTEPVMCRGTGALVLLPLLMCCSISEKLNLNCQSF